MRRRLLALFASVSIVLIGPLGGALVPVPVSAADLGPELREIHFPVEGAVSFTDDFGDPRSGGRTHEGNDLMGTKLQKLLATTDGVVSVRLDNAGLSGNMVTVRDADGWSYRYIHVNNDSPATDDGLNPIEWALAPGMEAAGVRVKAGQFIAYMGDSGNAEGTAPHLHFEIRRPDGTPLNPWSSLRLSRGLPAGTRCAYTSNPKAKPAASSAAGYRVLGSDGGIFSFGNAPFLGSVPGLAVLSPAARAKVKALRLASNPAAPGYWILGADGGVFSFGEAPFVGSVPGVVPGGGAPSVDLRSTRSGNGYWILGADGGVFAFGDAEFFGSLPGIGVTNKTIRLVPTSTGKGYWLLGADGGVFSFGDAAFLGSVPGLGLPSPAKVVAMAAGPASPAGAGYWVLGADGGVFAFGVPFFGSVPGTGLCRWPSGVQLVGSFAGKGYWVVAEDGSVFAFGDAFDHGDLLSAGVTGARVVDMAAVAPPRAIPVLETPSTTLLTTPRGGSRA